jgi:exo-1,4-beta-D-glucosaminidase
MRSAGELRDQILQDQTLRKEFFMTIGSRLALMLSLLLLASPFAQVVPARSKGKTQKYTLSEGWTLQSSAKVDVKGDVISTARFTPKAWYSVSVPTTVVASLVNQKIYPDPAFGMNLRQLPGVTYPIGANFSNLPMQPDSPFLVPWWYRKEFVLPADYRGKSIWLNFAGINYRANIWLNGKQIANSDQVAGAWRTYEFNVTDAVKAGASNVLAAEVYSPTDTNLSITFVDWNPAPPDKNMGLWREVYLQTTGPVALRYPTVLTKLDPGSDNARLSVTALVKNGTTAPVKGTLRGTIEKIEFSQEVNLAPGESKDVNFDPETFSQLKINHPRLWWPAQMGTPSLYPLSMRFEVGGTISDSSQTNFGIREITSQVLDHDKLLFTVNGKKVLIRGAGWTPDMMLRENSQRLADEFRYVRDMGLNTIRLEGKLETEEFFNLADREGILVIAGWCCCDHWEHWGNWSNQDYEVAKASVRDQIYRLRSHPSLLAWMNGSDNPPPPDVEEMYLTVEKQAQWPNPVVSSATEKPAAVTGDSGVKMTGPYEYVAPVYWTEDARTGPHHCHPGGCGGAYGFNTETGPGPAVPPIESLQMMLPKDHLWPIDDFWNFHAGGEQFKTIQLYTEAQNARYGRSSSAAEFAFKSQLMGYEGIRAMFEAYSRNKYTSTGVIQWMLNNGWPSIIWHLYDYYLRPGGGYFGAKKAMEPLHPVYSYDDHSIWVVSSQYADAPGLKLTANVFNLDMAEKFSKAVSLDAALADGTMKIFQLPQMRDLSPTYFLALRLEDKTGKLVGSNFYWLSTKPEILDWEKSTWYRTPTASYADYTALAQLPKVKLQVTSRTEYQHEDKEAVTHVTVANPSKSLAFFLRLKVDKGQRGPEILPVLWTDNYISLLPGEKRELAATYRVSELGAAKPAVEVHGWNTEE